MKSSLDHLPERKQREIAAIVEIIHEEFADTLDGATAGFKKRPFPQDHPPREPANDGKVTPQSAQPPRSKRGAGQERSDMTEHRQGHFHERMTITGDLDAASFLPWICRHAAKLGLSQEISHADAERIELELEGPEELIDMMEMGCSLGPIDVWVETIEREPVRES